MSSGLHHVAILVRDLAAAERFYTGVLGLPVVARWPAASGPGERSIWIGTGGGGGEDDGTFIAIEIAPPGATRAPGPDLPLGHHLLALAIAARDRAMWEARLAAAGVAVTHRTDYTIYFSDPEGNRLGLSHYPDRAPEPPPGAA